MADIFTSPRFSQVRFEEPTLVVLDQFTDTRAAGAVNSTAATPGPGTRTVSDTGSLVTTDGSSLLINGGQGTPAAGDPSLKYAAITRAAGVSFSGELGYANTTMYVGFDISGSGAVDYGLGTSVGNITLPDGTYLYGPQTDISRFSVVLRNQGYFICVDQKLLWISDTGNTASLYPYVAGYDAVGVITNLKVTSNIWSISPIVSEGFSNNNLVSNTRISDGRGHLEGINNTTGSGGSGYGWTDHLGTFIHASGLGYATALSSNEARTTVNASTADVIISAKLSTELTGYVGIILRYADASNYIYCKLDRSHLNLVKVVAGVSTSVAADLDITYVAGPILL